MRRAFIAPLLLHVAPHKPTQLSPVQHYRHNIRRVSGGKLRMSLASLDRFQTTRFPQSVELATEFLKTLPETLTPAHSERVKALLSTSDGTRGLFVALLSTEEITLAETPLHKDLSEIFCGCGAMEIAQDSGFSGEEIAVLAVKNVTMSSAMEVTYKEQGERELAKGSEMTRRRAVNVLKVVNAGNVARDMVRGLKFKEGRFAGFGGKWGYGDKEIEAAVEGLREACGDDVLQ